MRFWEHLVVGCDVKGKQAHDAKVAAAMARHNVVNLLTFNGGDFARYPAVYTRTPADVLVGRANLGA